MLAMHTLSTSGFTVYIPAVPGENVFIIEDQEGRLSKILVQRATATSKTPICTLSFAFNSSSYLEQYGYLLITEPKEEISWLIPIQDLPQVAKTIRLGDKYNQYILKLVAEEERNMTAKIRQNVRDAMAIEVEISEIEVAKLLE